MQPTAKDALEDLVDKYGLTDLLASLSGICDATPGQVLAGCGTRPELDPRLYGVH